MSRGGGGGVRHWSTRGGGEGGAGQECGCSQEGQEGVGDPQVGEVGAWPPSQPLLTCNNLPDSGGGHHACAGVRAATAAPWPVSAAPPTGRAWPAAGGPPTWGVGWPQAGLGGRGCLPNTEQPLRQEGQDEAGKELGSGGSFPRGRARSHLTGREHRSRAPARLQERSAAPGPLAPWALSSSAY